VRVGVLALVAIVSCAARAPAPQPCACERNVPVVEDERHEALPMIRVEDGGTTPSAEAESIDDAGPRTIELSASARTLLPGIASRLLDEIRAARACFGPHDPRGLRFTIDEAGHASDARDARGVRFGEPLASCVDRALSHARFPSPRGGAVTVVLPDATGTLTDEIVPLD
jgi:hypothetical protein